MFHREKLMSFYIAKIGHSPSTFCDVKLDIEPYGEHP